jgi:hypothetical protein
MSHPPPHTYARENDSKLKKPPGIALINTPLQRGASRDPKPNQLFQQFWLRPRAQHS